LPSLTSHRRTEKSSPPEANVSPSGWNARAPTAFSWPFSDVFSFPVNGSQMWISLPAVDAIFDPSLDQATARTGSFDPRYDRISRPLPRSQIFTDESAEAEASHCPLGEKATAETKYPCRIRAMPSTRSTCGGRSVGTYGTIHRASRMNLAAS